MSMAMKTLLASSWLAAFALLLAASPGPVTASEEPDEVPTADPRGNYEQTIKYLQRARAMQPTVVSPEMHVFKIDEDVWMHRSYISLGDQRLHANGLFFVGQDGITIIDAPWTPIASYDLLDWLEANFDVPVRRLVITHAHEDRLGGIDPFVERNTPVYGTADTADTARQRGWYAPNYTFDIDLPLPVGDRAIELLHPGPGHTEDNIVVWVPHAKVLFGGCMVKSRYAGSLGFTGDANEPAWPTSLRRMMSRYPDAKLVIPGHGLPGDQELVEHTLDLLED
ncbi:MAG: subclass B1 metallo-beta-lactamase [Gammaproteobacteria bacterium]|nr:subclass B1 metallo-beta-lactamase [Gammaproteobacteria bacterium]